MSVKPDYQVEVIPNKGMVRMTCIGFWDETTAASFEVDLDRAIKRLNAAGKKPGEYLFLADFRPGAIQSPVMVQRFQGFAATAGTQARRIAVLSAGVLQKMQAQRMAGSFDHYCFFLPGEETAAEAWLATGDPKYKPV